MCFSEVPLDKIERLTRRHGNFGIAFTKDFLRGRDAARVWYLDKGSSQAIALSDRLKCLQASKDFSDPVWDLTPFIDLLMPGTYEWGDWEREWRVRGDMNFTLADVAFVITPESVDELPAFDGFYIHPKYDLIVAASTQPLEEYLEGLVEQFFQTFEDPANSLPVDEGEYVWIVTEWETEEGSRNFSQKCRKASRPSSLTTSTASVGRGFGQTRLRLSTSRRLHVVLLHDSANESPRWQCWPHPLLGMSGRRQNTSCTRGACRCSGADRCRAGWPLPP